MEDLGPQQDRHAVTSGRRTDTSGTRTARVNDIAQFDFDKAGSQVAECTGVPSVLHEVLIEVFRNRPRLACELLELCAGIYLAADSVEAGPTDANQIAPAGYRADSLVILRDESGRATSAIIVESQLGPDPGKRGSWPVYIATARVRLACPVTLLVVVPDHPMARWARHPIELGHPGFSLAPIVICLADLPRLASLPEALHTPELALLCALGHPERSTKPRPPSR